MIVINVRNVNTALPLALDNLRVHGVRRSSRNDDVFVFPEPVTTVYRKPTERVVFWDQRDANPFFHLYESLWMLAGRNDVEGPAGYVENMRNFSDDGVTFHGAYGYRWRRHFNRDQLLEVIRALKANPDDRRQVVSMWDANADLGRVGKDLPCNLQALFQIAVDGRLDMTVTNRSNDLVWGAYGANAVHFSYLMEFVARGIGVEVGVYRQVSNNLHGYVDTLDKVKDLVVHADPYSKVYAPLVDPYTQDEVFAFPLMAYPNAEAWLDELDVFLADPGVVGLRDPFFRRVAGPFLRAHALYRALPGEQRYSAALATLAECASPDWRRAGEEWIQRRWDRFKQRRDRARDDGPNYGD